MASAEQQFRESLKYYKSTSGRADGEHSRCSPVPVMRARLVRGSRAFGDGNFFTKSMNQAGSYISNVNTRFQGFNPLGRGPNDNVEPEWMQLSFTQVCAAFLSLSAYTPVD